MDALSEDFIMSMRPCRSSWFSWIKQTAMPFEPILRITLDEIQITRPKSLASKLISTSSPLFNGFRVSIKAPERLKLRTVPFKRLPPLSWYLAWIFTDLLACFLFSSTTHPPHGIIPILFDKFRVFFNPSLHSLWRTGERPGFYSQLLTEGNQTRIQHARALSYPCILTTPAMALSASA